MAPGENEFDTPALEAMMLREIRQTEKDKYYMLLPFCGI